MLLIICAIVERASNEVSLSTGQPVDHAPEPWSNRLNIYARDP
jgi:hypothetical protein